MNRLSLHIKKEKAKAEKGEKVPWAFGKKQETHIMKKYTSHTKINRKSS